MTLSAGSKLGPYEVLSPLGAGGMGEVYRAWDSRLEREVAVKILPSDLARDGAALGRFEREAKAVAALSHPNILAIYDFGNEGTTTYAVLELLEGQTLRDALAQGALSVRKAKDLSVQIARGLAAAHEKGIVHRDLKPENIFVTKDGRAKILDFGIAKVVRPQAEAPPGTQARTQTAATERGVLVGTAGYMSPEQVRGEPASVASDIFSFGCVLYEMLSGRRAFSGSSRADTISAILVKEPPELRDVNPEVPPGLERIVRHCLEKQPQMRFHSAGDLAFDLETLGETDAASGPPSARAATPSRRSWWVAAGLLVAILVGAAILRTHSSRSISSLAVLPFVNASGDPNAEYLSDGITESLINSLAQLPDVRVVSRNSVFRFKGREMDAETAGRELDVRAVLTGRVVQRGADLSITAELADTRTNSHIWGERYERKFADLLAIQGEIVRDISSKLEARLTGEEKKRLNRQFTQSTEAYDLYLKGRYHWNKRTAEDLQRGIEFFRLAIEKDPAYALAYSGLADTYGVMPVHGFPPGDAFAKARAAAQRSLEIDESLAQPHAVLALVHESIDWDFPAAEREYRRAIQADPRYPTAHQWYSLFLFYMGRTDEGTREAQRAYELDPLSLIINNLQTMASYYSRRDGEALERARKTLDLDRNFPPAHLWLGNTLARAKQFPEAINELEKAIQLIGRHNEALSALGYACAASGRKSDALAVIAELEKWPEQGYDPTVNIALVYAGLGETEEAMRWLEKAFQARSTWFSQLALKVDPRWDTVRADPRFGDLLKRIGFPS